MSWLVVLALSCAACVPVACSLFEPRIDYEELASGLPALDDLADRATAFRSTLIYDRDGNLLNEAFDPNSGKRTVVPLDLISRHLQNATIATEDARFYEHGGVDPVAVARAAWYLVREGEVVSGASTIPQQLVKRLYLSPERSVKRKVIEAALAREISGMYGKDEILTLYLNEIYYGNMAYGAQAAATTYFGKNASDLSLAEAALLAGLPQAPAYLDPYANPDRAKRRQRIVLGLMAKAGYISDSEAETAADQPLDYRPPRFDLKAPHFTLYVREQVERLFGPEALYSRGLNVYTTLDSALQKEAESSVADHVASLAAKGATNGALVAIRPDTGEILALVGSAGFDDDTIDGQINMALVPRQPGSALKPFVYLSAFESATTRQGDPWTPGTLIADVATAFPDGANAPYVPTNYDDAEHGLVTVRDALANSYNIPAVKALQAVGIDSYIELARRVGITTLNRQDYGLSLALGSGEVPLVEVVSAFSVLANGGMRQQPVTIRRITDSSGEVLCELGSDTPCVAGAEGIERQRVVDAVDAFLLTDILSDSQARAPAFGTGSWLEIGRTAAVKTGTTNDARDGWTVGYTPDLVAGVWVGNADNSPMHDVSGFSAAAPIWNRFMKAAHADLEVSGFRPPKGVEQFVVCADTGAMPGPACPDRRVRWFASDSPPLPPDRDLWQLFNGQPYKWFPDEYRWWAELHGIAQPPLGMLPDGAIKEQQEVVAALSATPTATRTVSATATATWTPTGTATPTLWPTWTSTVGWPTPTATSTNWGVAPYATNTPRPSATEASRPTAAATQVPATETPAPPTELPPSATPVPPTAAPTEVPPSATAVPPTAVPPTSVPPTAVPPTSEPPSPTPGGA